jgi:hypothetical protein
MPAATAKKGDTLSCEVCGLSVVVDEVCGCAEAHEIICCDVPMKPKRARATKAKPRSAAKPKAKAKAKARK